MQSYRKLSVSMHPDKNKEEGSTEAFHKIGKAYEVLKANETRSQFDYYLDHPWDYYTVSGQYFMRNMPKSNVFVVLTAVLALLSVLLYQVQLQNHAAVKKRLLRQVREGLGPRNGGSEHTQALLDVCTERFNEAVKRGDGKRVSKTRMLEDQRFQDICRQVVAEVEITGGDRKPTFDDILIVRVAKLPLTLLSLFTAKTGGTAKKDE